MVSKRGEKYNIYKNNFTTYSNFAQMYENVEASMIHASVAKKRPVPVFVNEKGEEVSESKSVGLKSSTKLTYPQYCVAFDECGNNTSMEKDGHFGNQKFIVQRGTRARTLSGKKISTLQHWESLVLMAR